MILWDKMNSAVSDSSKNFIATTDPEKGSLRKIADEKGFRTLSIPQGVVGRYSVLSPVGLLLAEVIGIDSNEMLKGARDIHSKCSDPEIWKNPAYLFGTLLYLMEREEKRNINVLIPYADGLKPTAEWFCQLWAESLGKSGSGLTPYPSLGTTDQHSQLQLWMEGPEDKVVVFIKVDDYGVDFEIPKVFKDVEGTSYLGGTRSQSLLRQSRNQQSLPCQRLKGRI